MHWKTTLWPPPSVNDTPEIAGGKFPVKHTSDLEYSAFVGHRHIASGTLVEVALKAKERVEGGEQDLITIFHNETGKLVDLGYRGTAEEFLTRVRREHDDYDDDDDVLPAADNRKRSGPGRPRLGVVAREVTLLPRHWEWLNAQPGGASATLRKLVERARRDGYDAERARRLRDGAYRFMSFMAGDFPDFEEASRALFARDYERFNTLIEAWPHDVRAHLQMLVHNVNEAEAQAAAAPRTSQT